MKGTRVKNLTYLSFVGGQLRERVEEGTKDAKSREIEKGPNKGKVIWEVAFDWIEGKLSGMEVDPGDYGKRWKFTIQDGDETYLRLRFRSR